MRLVAYPLVVLVLTLPSVALAQPTEEEGPPPPPVTAPPVAAPPVATPPIVTTPLVLTTPPPPSPFEVAPNAPTLGPGVALGYENGLWGSNFTQSLRLRIPFSPRWGMVVKGVITHPTDHHHNVMAHYGGGRLEIFGVSNPIAGFARVYGGGGLVVTTKILGTGGTTDVHYGLGGYLGLEVFMTRHTSLTLEVGGSSNADGTVAGATVIAGLQWYFGK